VESSNDLVVFRADLRCIFELGRFARRIPRPDDLGLCPSTHGALREIRPRAPYLRISVIPWMRLSGFAKLLFWGRFIDRNIMDRTAWGQRGLELMRGGYLDLLRGWRIRPPQIFTIPLRIAVAPSWPSISRR